MQKIPARQDHPSTKPRILIADADAGARSLYGEVLRRAGWDVAEASDGREALTLALVNVPEVVLTELQLPFIDGPSLFEILRRDRTTARVPILAVTDESRSSELERARRAGVDGVLIKPTTPEALLQEINRLLHRSSVAASPSQDAIPVSDQPASARPTTRSKAYVRYSTTTPPNPPPDLICPSCDSPLTYVHSHVGGVSDRHVEQWDRFTCGTCGIFQYRHRTRRLRRARA